MDARWKAVQAIPIASWRQGWQSATDSYDYWPTALLLLVLAVIRDIHKRR